MVDLSTRLRSVVGDSSAKKLEKAFGMTTVDDLLRHYPRRYVGIGELSDLSTLQPGQYATIQARVLTAENKTFKRRGTNRTSVRTEVVVTDGTARLNLTFFSQAWRLKQLTPGRVGLFAGEVGSFRNTLQLTHPIFEPIEDEDGPSEGSRLARGVIPIYPASAAVSSPDLEKAVGIALDVVELGEDPLPADVRAARGLADQAEAFEHIHRPRANEQWQRARDRFRFEEAFVLQSVFAQRRHAVEHDLAKARETVPDGLRERFTERLPFTLTAGQREVADVISADLTRTHPMHRLLQGEVGSGKTVVALLAMLQVVDAGGQAALLAPTEVLAAQHHRAISTLLGDLAQGGMLGGAEQATRVQLLTGSLSAKARREALDDVASGEAGIVVGTHALIQEGVAFADLGLLVVDEQHRFGVEQRSALVDRSEVKPHVLVMTATPIPRTVAMTVFGDLETSTLRELPAGRQPVQTTVVPAAERPEWLARAWERVREEVDKGRQAYVVVSRIGAAASGGDEDKDTTSLVDLHDELAGGPLSGLRLAMLHGQLPADEKDAVMRSFAAGDIDVLVATTVVEVGVDVPNATVMVVMDADRFGVSQLHQLRGRVGRGTEPGLCLLVTNSEVEVSRERLAAVAATSDGFELSQLDVELRHEGDVLGSRQSGVRSSLRLLSVVRHEDVIVDAREAARAVVEADPTLAEHRSLAAAIRALEETEQADYLERT